MSHSAYVVGIDLGTTNSTMSCAAVAYPNKLKNGELDSATAPGLDYPGVSKGKADRPRLEQIAIAQLMSSQVFDAAFSLPSFIYYPLREELEAQGAEIPSITRRPYVVGTFARDRGSELPHRLIASAKSWLCHSGINRREELLPLEADEDIQRMSPLMACAEILRHLRESWEAALPDVSFGEQNILITVPASFDPSARQLVQEAAEEAGYPEIVLLEEPQAAFYAWLHAHADEWRQQLSVGDSILVVDIGGGTTDFSLIHVEEEAGTLLLRRQAVGAHLLLGGDNVDLGLAYLAKQKLEKQGHMLDEWQFRSLVHQCRQAKEKLLGESPPEKVAITLLGRGSRLIGNTLLTELSCEEVRYLVLDGFIPRVAPDERSPSERRMGIRQVGLPYAQDPRISCQLAKFLSMTGEQDGGGMDQFIVPTAVLFNGGTLKAAAVRERLLELLNTWARELGRPPVKELAGADYDYAVSRGAAYYGLVRRGQGIRIRGGTSRSYFVGIEAAIPAVPGLSPPLWAVCIVPFGLEEGEECSLDDQEFALVLGEQAAFRFFSCTAPKLSDGEEPAVGRVVRNWQEELRELHPIEAMLDRVEGEGKTVRVKLKAKVTELGVLELWCVAADGRKWKLEFDIRDDRKCESASVRSGV